MRFERHARTRFISSKSTLVNFQQGWKKKPQVAMKLPDFCLAPLESSLLSKLLYPPPNPSVGCWDPIYEIRVFIFSTWGSQKKWVRSRIFDDFEENFRSECRSAMSVVRSGGRGPLRGGRSGGRSEWSDRNERRKRLFKIIKSFEILKRICLDDHQSKKLKRPRSKMRYRFSLCNEPRCTLCQK